MSARGEKGDRMCAIAKTISQKLKPMFGTNAEDVRGHRVSPSGNAPQHNEAGNDTVSKRAPGRGGSSSKVAATYRPAKIIRTTGIGYENSGHRKHGNSKATTPRGINKGAGKKARQSSGGTGKLHSKKPASSNQRARKAADRLAAHANGPLLSTLWKK